MARTRALARARSISTRALLLKRVLYSESDLVLTLFTEELGRVSALARGARRSQRRFGGALEPMHTLGVRLDERSGVDLLTLREASIAVARRRLVENLDCIDAAGRALCWVRSVAPAHTPEPAVWRVLADLLDRLDAPSTAPSRDLALAGLGLLTSLGWGIDFLRCVRCGRPYEPARGAFVDAERGGLVCRACGGARRRLPAALLSRLQASSSDPESLRPEDADAVLDLVDEALRAHAGIG